MSRYIYLIKYYGNIIAAADDDEWADKVIKQYIRNNVDMDMENFEKEPIRFFTNEGEIYEV